MKLKYFCPICEEVFNKKIKCPCGNGALVEVEKTKSYLYGYNSKGGVVKFEAYGNSHDEERKEKRKDFRKGAKK